MAYEYKPIPPAIKFHLSLKRIRLCACGAQSGKTHASLGANLVMDALLQPGYFKSDIKSGRPYRILVCEPRCAQTKEISWPEITSSLDPSRILKSNDCNFIVYRGIWGTTRIVFRSYEQGSGAIEGNGYYRIYLDECFQMPEQYFNETIVRSATRLGKIIMTGTPRPNKFILDMIKNWKKGQKQDLVFFTWKTEDNPHYPREGIEYARRTMPPKLFAREFEAALDVFKGQIYDSFNESVHVQDFEFNKDNYLVVNAGQDWGYTHHGALVIYGITKDFGVDILEVIAKQGIPVSPPTPSYTGETWTSIAKAKVNEYGIDCIYAGPDEPEHIKAYRDNDIFCQAADNSVHAGIQFIMTLMHIDGNGHTRYRIRRGFCEKLLDEKITYKWKENRDGEFSEEPEKTNDDACDAERYGIYSARSWLNS